MDKNRVVIYTTIIALIFVIGCPTIYKVVKNHHNKLYTITEKRIIEAARKCWNEDKCKENTITLKTLYDNKYLTNKESDPVTKKYYSEASKIIKKEEIKFYPE